MSGWHPMEGNGDETLGSVGDFRFTDAMGRPDGGPGGEDEAPRVTNAGPSDGGDSPELGAAQAALSRYLDFLRAERERVIEEWCERSLTDPEGRGVVIVNDGPTKFYIGLDASVPFGTIQEYESPPWGTEG